MYQVLSKPYTLLVLVCVCLTWSGCRSEKLPEGMPKPYPLVVTVIQDGKPLEGATIALLGVDSSNIWSAGGATDASGKASLKTSNKYHGVVPGKYYYVIQKFEADKNAAPVPDEPMSQEEYEKSMSSRRMRKIMAGYDLVDPKFAKISPTSETIEVKEEKNEQTIDVGKAVRIERIITALQ